MKAISVVPVARNGQKEIVRAVLVADSIPTTLPTTGSGIDGMNADMVFAPFSVMYIVGKSDSKVYITNESGKFIAQ